MPPSGRGRRGIILKDREQALRVYMHAKANTYMAPEMFSGRGTAVAKAETLQKMLKQWKADAIILHYNRGCEFASLQLPEVRQLLLESGDIPILTYEAWGADTRDVDMSKIVSRADDFFQNLGVKKLG